jgi:predicted Rdx family selenoprotein
MLWLWAERSQTLSTDIPQIVVIYKGKKHFVVGAKNVGKDLVYDLRRPGMLPSDGLIKANSREIIFEDRGFGVEEPNIVY